jgi:protein gp37
MSKTTISWTDETINPFVGCTKVSEECRSCYAEAAAASPRLQQFPQYKNVVDEHGHWTGHVEFIPRFIDKLFTYKKPRRIFLPSMSDAFHENVKDEWLDQLFAAIALNPHLTLQILTKRPRRMMEYCNALPTLDNVPDEMSRRYFDKTKEYKEFHPTFPLPNLWLGVTAGTQKSADDRIPLLLQTPAAVRFVSVEPMLEEVNLSKYLGDYWTCPECNDTDEFKWMLPKNKEFCGVCAGDTGRDVRLKRRGQGIHQVIVGGESGSKSREFHLEWAEDIHRQCQITGTKFFMKQVGANAYYRGQQFKTKSRAGADASEWPEHLRVQEFPGGRC